LVLERWSKLIAFEARTDGTLVFTISAHVAETYLENLVRQLCKSICERGNLILIARRASIRGRHGEQSGDRNLLGPQGCRLAELIFHTTI